MTLGVNSKENKQIEKDKSILHNGTYQIPQNIK